METFKKILAVLVMVICVLGIAIALSGIVGSWVANQLAIHQGSVFLEHTGQVLAGVDTGLKSVEGGLGTVDQLIEQVKQIPLIGNLVAGFSQNVGGLSGQITDVHGQVTELQGIVATLQANLRSWVNLATLAVDLFLVWFGLAQVSVFYHGLDWYRKAGESPPRQSFS